MGALASKETFFQGKAVALLLLVAIALRIPIFFLTHANNDEIVYTNLAMKLDTYGLKTFTDQYNNFYVNLKYHDSTLELIPSEEKITSFSRAVSLGLGLENEILSHHPPGFSFFLALSHQILCKDKPYILLSKKHPGPGIDSMQFYATVVPFIFSLLLIVSTYLLGRMLFSAKIGLWAAFIIALTPTDLLTAQKIWADDMVAFFGLATIMLYLLSLKKDQLIYAALAGLSCGIAILGKMSGGFIALAIILFHFYKNKELILTRKIYTILLERRMIVFLAFSLICVLPWLVALKNNFGLKTFFLQFEPVIRQAQQFPEGFIKTVHSRPLLTYLVTIPYQFPLYFLGYFSFISLLAKGRNRENVVFLCIWYGITLILLTLRQDKEERYILPALPALALLSAISLNNLKITIETQGRKYLWFGIYLFLFLSIYWACRIGMLYVFERADIIPIPY